MKMECNCGHVLTRENSEFLGLIRVAHENDYDLELYECAVCEATRCLRIYNENGILDIETKLKRSGFFEEAEEVGRFLRIARLNSYAVREG